MVDTAVKNATSSEFVAFLAFICSRLCQINVEGTAVIKIILLSQLPGSSRHGDKGEVEWADVGQLAQILYGCVLADERTNCSYKVKSPAALMLSRRTISSFVARRD